jgi:hypothetical protein
MLAMNHGGSLSAMQVTHVNAGLLLLLLLLLLWF